VDALIDTRTGDLINPEVDVADETDTAQDVAADLADISLDSVVDAPDDSDGADSISDRVEEPPGDVAEDGNVDLEVVDQGDVADGDESDLADGDDDVDAADDTNDADVVPVICEAGVGGCSEADDLLICSDDGTAWVFDGECDYACQSGVCQSNVCGDGYHEPLQDESGDDGNALSCDGCEGCSALASGVFTTATNTTSSVVWAPGTGNFTIEGWVEVTGDGALFGIGDVGVTDSVKAEIADGVLRIVVDLGSAGFTVAGSSDLRGTGWHHLAVVRFATWGGAVFVDGHLEGLAHQEIGSSSLDGEARLWIGAESTLTAAPGHLDEVRFSAAARYQTGFTPSRRHTTDDSTVALFHFDEGVGLTAADASGNGRNLTFVGLNWVADDCYGSANEAASCGDGLQAPWESCDSDATSCVGCAVVPDCSGVFGPNGSCYTFHTEDKWTDAQATCRGYGADLITLDDETENDWLTFLLGFTYDRWIGLNDRDSEGNFVWSDGSTSAFRHWNGGEPNNFFGEDCAVIYPNGAAVGRWNDEDCGRDRRYICER